VWRWKHAVIHHTYVNITGHDTDIDFGFMARMTPHQKRLKFHRWQHLYLWLLYGLFALRWHLLGDMREYLSGRINGQRFPRPRGRELAIFVGGKVIFVTLAFGLPILMHPVWVALLFYTVTALVLGIVLSMIFQLAHCVEEAEFPLPAAGSGQIENAWAIHQAQTTVDFARGSRIASWLFGGLNFQIEHHLFPRICHIHYPAISKLVEQTCRDFGVKYAEHASVWAGVVSHFRWLRRLGRAEAIG
jgi:linoleoyl-CoA desaturase